MEIFNFLKQLGMNLSSEEGRSLFKGAVVQAFIVESSQDGRASLRLGSKVVQAFLKQPVEAGQTVRLEVLETSPQLVFRPVREEPGAGPPRTPPSNTPANPEPAPEEKRPVFSARIVEKLPDGRIRIQILNNPKFTGAHPEENQDRLVRNLSEGRQLSARIHDTGLGRPLRLGQDVRFVIKETQPQLVLEPSPPKADPSQPLVQVLTRFLSRPEKMPQEIRELLTVLEKDRNFPPEIRNGIDRLVERMTALSPKPAEPDIDFVPRLISGLGINHPKASIQNETARLWSEIVRSPILKNALDHEGLKLLTEGTARIFESVETLQVLNQETSRFEQTLFFSFPLFWPGEKGRGELTFKRPQERKRSDREEPYRITLLLNLTRLGRIKADISIKGVAVQGAIWTENTESQSRLIKALDTFSASLGARGITVEHLQVNIFPADNPPPDSLAAEMLPQKKGLIDVKV